MSKPFFYSLWVLLLGQFSIINAAELPIRQLTVDEIHFRALAIKPSTVNLHWQQDNGQAFRRFSTLKKSLVNQNTKVLALMNAGIYGKDDKPAGLHIEHGAILHSINTNKGQGNFHIQPNGVFLITKTGEAKILTTKKYQKQFTGREAELQLATQSGPMLLINGKINHRLLPDSQSTYTRNGVCTTAIGELFFVATTGVASSFYQFTRATEQLGCTNTLYLDGSISKLYLTERDFIFHLPHYVGILSVTHSTKD